MVLVPTVSVNVNGEWIPFDSLNKEQQLKIRKQIGDVLGGVIRQQVERRFVRQSNAAANKPEGRPKAVSSG